MKVILLVLAIGALAWAMAVFVQVETTQSAIHEIEALILLLIASILFVGAAIIDAVASISTAPGVATKPQTHATGMAAEVESELESGAVDVSLWAVAKQMAGSPDEKKIRGEYIKLRIKSLQNLREGTA